MVRIMKTQQLKQLVLKELHDHKAIDITTIDVSKITSVTDYMIICSASSNRHAKTLADYVVSAAKDKGIQPLGVEGDLEGEWILVDLVDIVIHIMLPQVRAFYNLEKLWSIGRVESA